MTQKFLLIKQLVGRRLKLFYSESSAEKLEGKMSSAGNEIAQLSKMSLACEATLSTSTTSSITPFGDTKKVTRGANQSSSSLAIPKSIAN